jgi:PAS domain S-box-containing protein
MALHPGEQKRRFSEELPVTWDPIRRDLEINEDWYRNLVENSQDALCVHDLEGRFLSVNSVPARLLGYSVEEMLRRPMRDFLDPQFHDQFDGYLRDVARTGKARGMMAVVTRSGERRIWEYHNTLRTEGVETPIVHGIARDVTERVRAEKALRVIDEQMVNTALARKQAEERLREFERVVENLEEMIVVVNREYRFVLANRLFLSNRRMKKEEVVGRLVAELVNAEVYETVIKGKLDECFQGKVVNYELRHVYPELGEREISITYLPVEGSAGIDRVACVMRDVTERKRAEEALRESEARERERAKELETVLEAVPVAVCISHDADCLRITGNRAADEQMRVPAGKNISMSASPEERPSLRILENGQEVATGMLPMQLAAATGKPVHARPLTVIFQDGTAWETLSTAVPLFDEEGKVRGAVGASIDLTELKQAEKALRDNELLFRTVYERSPVGIALVDSHSGQFLQVNPKFCEIVGRGEEELLRLDVASITHPDDIVLGSEYREQLAEEKLTSYEMDKRYVRPDGSMRWVRILVVPMWSKGETRRWQMGLVQDITEQRQSEGAIATLVQEVCDAKKKLTEEKLYLEQEIDTELGFGDIIGQSKALQSVMEQVGKVAASDATVLLLGETGTGKELVARAIHRLSRRSHNAFIKLNCAAIPSGLLESELFGNEKGAFTGAVNRKIGRLELADRGTLFLDEIGEISLTLQPKLLRVLQDQEFERLGGTQTLKVDFRLIAATNRDLADSVRANEFRSDLYYRLNVFPIRVPPLRERREDIRLLVEHFVQKFTRRMNKSITSIPKKTMDALMGWEWPGNVRELENFIERSVILTQGSVLAAPLIEMESLRTDEKSPDETLEATERLHILRALRESHGQIGGLRGAAMRLGLKRTTLQSKLKHLGIDPRSPHT